ncbi:hypothetical protein SAMN05444392_1114 [Seinonella peptonophila]|uniref:Uncharacterized protein n=1 Tax=Seinonella peptonophila TaxID=112248 RepID=A0A1M4ZVP2_9BACL|nr:hypothetical protein [Seinonella peptonophila]SHF22088.1 hypothetical protein SAMN05444392_1114 [Seinonella peptonophila]
MKDEKLTQKLEQFFQTEENKTEQDLQSIFFYPFHSDMRFLLFEVMGYHGDYGITLHSMIDFGKNLNTNAKGESLIDLPGFTYAITIPVDPKEEIELFELANEFIVEWFIDRFHQAGGVSFPYDCYLMWHDDVTAIDMKKRVRIDTELLYNE